MARILCISSQTVFGPVGNSAAVPALQAEGHEVMQIPTVLLSNHPGLGKPVGQSTPAPLIEDMCAALQVVGALDDLAAVMTGYFTSAAQVIAVAKQIAALKATREYLHVLVDPVIGDHGKLYVSEDVAHTIKQHLLPLATVTTPNLFELQYLAGTEDIVRAVQVIGANETIVTSVPDGPANLATELHLANQMSRHSHTMTKRSKVPNGTGDYLAGCYLAQRLIEPAPQAFAKAMARLEATIIRSAGSNTLKIS